MGTCISDSNSLQIQLQEKDSDFLEKFNVFMRCSRKVIYYKRKKNFKTFSYVRVSYQSKKLTTDLLSNFLIKPRKSLNCPFPKHLSFDNKLSYIIGNLDGDGSVFKRANKNLFTIQWLGDFKFLSRIKNLFFRLGWIPNNMKYLQKESAIGLHKLRFTGIIAKFIYRKLKMHIKIHQLPVLKRKWINKLSE